MLDPPLAGQGDTGSTAVPVVGETPPADPLCVLPPAADETDWTHSERRRLPRHPVQASRPIALRLLDEQGVPAGRWHLADILDISLGGLCLMVNALHHLPIGQAVQLDLRAHPDFGVLRLTSAVTWCREAQGFSTMGLVFAVPLARIPRLEVERRSVRRDPNDEPWAQDEIGVQR